MLKQVGKYTISERIGRGTYSRVYRAVDSQGRPVALKVSTTPTEPEQLNEFQRDLVTAASVLHPNLVAVRDLGFEDDFPYLVMELVEGSDLDKILKSKAAPALAERIRAMQQVGDALKSAHERGVFHLDIRPSKIMLDNEGVAKLLDLGLGRLSFDPARLTDHGYLVGAPFYMSPERLTAIDTANERCDIWSFGVTFYEWISGRHPFYDDDGDQMIGNIMDGMPAELAGVPAPLNHAILRALEKDPADRYQNFAELLADLRPLVSDLKREESDALMAEALKQTDSGRWHEARRIARQMRDLEPQEAQSSQMFGFSEQELEKERIAERTRPLVAAPVASPVQPLVAAAAVAAAASSAATAVDTPEPAPPPVQRQPFAAAPAAPAPVAAPPKPPRPERTAPKIPSMGGARNGSPVVENGSTANARAKAVPRESNGARAAAAAAAPSSTAAKPAVGSEMDTAPRAEATRTRPPRPARTVPPQPTVRILEIEESSGFPWLKIFAFALPALLMMGALFYFLRPISKLSNPLASSSAEAKEISPASRVIKGDSADPLAIAAPSRTPAGSEPLAGTPSATSTNGQPDAATDALQTPRTFDPKSLIPAKLPAQLKRRTNGALPGLAAPTLGGNSEVADSATLPVALNAPPPPLPVAKPAAPAIAISTPAVSSTPPTSEAAKEAAAHVGGVFAQPQLVHTVQPIYPPAALQRKTQGVVRFQATITKDGSVKNLQLVSGDPLLNVAAKQAVLQWKYRPALLNGDAVEVTQAIVVKFNLNQ
jgi:TonB family protein